MRQKVDLWLPGDGGGGSWEWLLRIQGFFLGETEMFWNWIVVMVAQLCEC